MTETYDAKVEKVARAINPCAYGPSWGLALDQARAALAALGISDTAPVVAVLEFAHRTPGRENEMPRVISCNWMPDGRYEVFMAPAPAISGGMVSVPREPTEAMIMAGHAAITKPRMHVGNRMADKAQDVYRVYLAMLAAADRSAITLTPGVPYTTTKEDIGKRISVVGINAAADRSASVRDAQQEHADTNGDAERRDDPGGDPRTRRE